MQIGNSVYTMENGKRKVGTITSIIDSNYYIIKFPNKATDISVHKDKFGVSYFLYEGAPLPAENSNQSSTKLYFKSAEEEEQHYANQIIEHFGYEIEELKNIYFQRNNKYQIEAFESAESIKRKSKLYEKIMNDPFKYHLFYEIKGQSNSVRLGAYDVHITEEQIVHSVNSPLYGQLLMQNRLAASQILIGNDKYFIQKRRDIHFNSSTKKITNLNEVEFSREMSQMTTENMDKYLIDSLSEDELYQTRLKTNSSELQEIFWTMTGTQHQIVREDVNTPLFIQGGAGTGKTSVGIHRISYLLYNKLIHEAIALGPNEHFAHYIEDSLANMGIESHQKVQTLSRLNFYINYLDQINQYVTTLTTRINDQLDLLNLDQLQLNNHLTADEYKLSPVSSTVKSMTQTIITSVPWNQLKSEIKKLKNLFQLNLIDEFNNFETFLSSFTSVLEKFSESIEYRQLQDSIKEKENLLKELAIIINKKQNEIYNLKLLTNDLQIQHDLVLSQVNEIEEHHLPIKQTYETYKQQLEEAVIFHEQLLNQIDSDHEYQNQVDLSLKLKETTQAFLDYISDDYNKGEKKYNQLLEKYIALHDELEISESRLSELSKEIKQLVRTQTSTKFNYQNDQQRFKQLQNKVNFNDKKVEQINTTINTIVQLLNELTPNHLISTEADNILLWIHYYFTLYPNTSEFYKDTYFFIDEAQDIPAFEFVLFHAINSQRVLFVGDVNQNIFGYNNFRSWEKHCQLYKAKFYELQYNWRSTKPIVKEAQQYIINYDYKNLGVVSGYPIKQKMISSLKELTTLINDNWIQEKVKFLPSNKSCAIIALNKVQFTLLQILLKSQIERGLIDIFDGNRTIKPQKLTLTSIDYVKGLEFFSTIIPLPHTDNFDQFEKARVYTALTRATDDLTVFLIDEQK